MASLGISRETARHEKTTVSRDSVTGVVSMAISQETVQIQMQEARRTEDRTSTRDRNKQIVEAMKISLTQEDHQMILCSL